MYLRRFGACANLEQRREQSGALHIHIYVSTSIETQIRKGQSETIYEYGTCGGFARAQTSNSAGSSLGHAMRVASSEFGSRSGCSKTSEMRLSQAAWLGGSWRKARRTAAKPRRDIQCSQRSPLRDTGGGNTAV